MTIAWIDFETRSRCDLLTRGAYNYARDPSTVPLCMAYAFDDEPVRLWTPDTACAILILCLAALSWQALFCILLGATESANALGRECRTGLFIW